LWYDLHIQNLLDKDLEINQLWNYNKASWNDWWHLEMSLCDIIFSCIVYVAFLTMSISNIKLKWFYKDFIQNKFDQVLYELE